MILDSQEFIRRFLLHILSYRFIKIRHYGLLSNRRRHTKLNQCKELLGMEVNNEENNKEQEKWQELILRITDIDYRLYPCCEKGNMNPKRVLVARSCSPPNEEKSVA